MLANGLRLNEKTSTSAHTSDAGSNETNASIMHHALESLKARIERLSIFLILV